MSKPIGIELAELVELNINEALDFETGFGNPFSLDFSLMFGVDVNEVREDCWATDLTLIGAESDLYDLLEQGIQTSSIWNTIALVTTGWASPLGENGEVECPPSQHKDKRRLRMVLIGDLLDFGVSSCLRFQDNGEILSVGADEASGLLAEAFQAFMKTTAHHNQVKMN